MTSFFQAFGATLESLVDIFLVIAVAGFLVRKKVVTQEHISGMSQLTVKVFLPCLIFANVVTQFDPEGLAYWWVLPLLAVAYSVVGLILAVVVFAPHWKQKKDMLPLASMHNAGYLVLPVGLKLLPESFDQFALYCFLFIMGFNPVLWSVGKFLMTDSGRGQARWSDLLTPPLIASVAAIFLVLTATHHVIPETIVGGVSLLGDAAVPIATFVLGAILGGIPFRIGAHIADAARTVLVKLFLFPLVVVMVLIFFDIHAKDPLLAQFLVIQAATAPAVALILQVRSYGGNEQKISSIMLVHYVLCLMTLPAWVAFWRVWTG